MKADERKRPTLADAQQKARTQARAFRPSDFLTKAEAEELKNSVKQAKERTRERYSPRDAVMAEILARFGFGAYQAWLNGEISDGDMFRFLQAERAREIQQRLNLEGIMLGVGISNARPHGKHGGMPKGIRAALDIYKQEIKIAGVGKQ